MIHTAFPKQVKIVEVGPRDGLQNEKKILPSAAKIDLIARLTACGISHIEAGSFVNPQRIPQLADSEVVFAGIASNKSATKNLTYSALVPNVQGMERAIASGVDEIAIFAAASETFSQNNINCSIVESLKRFEPVMSLARQHQIPVRGYLSCVLGCPFEGEITNEQVLKLADEMLQLGCYELSFGDTIGVGTPLKAKRLVSTLLAGGVPLTSIALHFHNTYGQALANIFACLELGVSIYDSAVAGLGGCPYAKKASGNIATEDLLYMLNGMHIETGVDLAKLIETSHWISTLLERSPSSAVATALSGNC